MISRRNFLTHSSALGLAGIAVVNSPSFGRMRDEERFRHSDQVVFEVVRTDGLALNSYFIGDKKSGTAAVIDPRRDVEVFLDLEKKHQLKITHALETHIHADFVSGARELADRTGTAKVYCCVEGDAKYEFPVQPIKHKTEIDLGNVVLTAFHTPGHTPEHVSYMASEKNAPNKPFALLTGDFLFVESVGRPDLLGEEKTVWLAKKLFQTIQTAFQGLPDPTPIYPAHGAGSPCGSNIVDRDSTLGLERKNNPALQIKDEGKFIDWLLFSQPPVPYYWPRMKKLNAAGPEILKRLPKVDWLSPRTFQTMIADKDIQLIDNRQMLAYGGGHIPGALNLGPKADLSMWAGWMLNPDKPVALVLNHENDLNEVLRWFTRVGYIRFAGALKGGMDAWVQDGLPLATIPTLSVHGLNERLSDNELQIVDVRQPVEWDMGHLPNAKYIFLPELPQKLNRLDKSKPVAVYCASGYRSSIASGILKKNGFNVYNVPGSYKAWTSAELPVQTPKSPGRGTNTERTITGG